MKLEKLNTTLTLTANIGVLIGLLLVAYELRQNDNTLDASIQLSLSSSYEELATFGIENPNLSQSILRLFGGDELDANDLLNIMGWQYRHLLILYTTFNLYQDGIVSFEIWRERASHFTVFMIQSERFTQVYNDSTHEEMFSSEFFMAIDEIYREQLADYEGPEY